MLKDGLSYTPAIAKFADPLRIADEEAVDEHLAELGVAGDLAQRADVDLRGSHVADESGEARMLRHVWIGSRQDQPPAGLTGKPGPRLLPRGEPPLGHRDCACRQARQIGSSAW